MAEIKYKPGDKFMLTLAGGEIRFGIAMYTTTKGLVLSDEALDKMERYDEAKIVRQAIQRRIDELTAMVVAFEKERDALCNRMHDGCGENGQ